MRLRRMFTLIKTKKELLISLTSLVLSIVTIYIMITTNKIMETTNEIMKTTNKIMETQIEVEKADKLPIINFKASYQEEESGFAAGEIITIHNEGGILKDFESKEITYLEIKVLDYSREDVEIKITIPIDDYYDSAFTTGAFQKKIITYANFSNADGNNRKRFDVTHKFIKIVKPYSKQKANETGKAFSIAAPEFKTFFYVTYKDVYNQKYEVYYEVDNFGAKTINKSTGEKLFSSEVNQFIQLDDINENMLLKMIEKKLDK